MEKSLFNLRFTAKQLQRQSKKCQKEEVQEKNKIKKAMAQGNMEGARIYAENSVRKQQEALNLLRLSSKLDAVASRVQSAVTMRKVVSGSMVGVVRGMDSAMRSMNLEKISNVLAKFEEQFDDLDVQSNQLDSSITNSVTAHSSLVGKEEDVDRLMSQVGDELGLEVATNSSAIPQGMPAQSASNLEKKDDELEDRLAKLRNL